MNRLPRYACFLIFAITACSAAPRPEPRAVSARSEVQVVSPVRILAPRPSPAVHVTAAANATRPATTSPLLAPEISHRTVLAPLDKGDGTSMGWIVGYAMRTLNEADAQSARPRRRQRDERL